MPSSETKTLLVIGGGLAGLCAIVGFRKAEGKAKSASPARIVLVEPKDHCEVYWGAYRGPFEEWVAKDSLLDLPGVCERNKVEHIQTTVSKLTRDTATLANGTVLKDFDVCVLAVGATCAWKGMGRYHKDTLAATKEARLAQMKSEGERLLQAEHLVIVGGGLVGAELAGDIAGYGAKKAAEAAKDATDKKAVAAPKVTLVHSRDRLCLEMNESASAMVKKQLESRGVRVILGEKAETDTGGGVKLLNSGEVLKDVDEVIYTTGFQSVTKDFLDWPSAIAQQALDGNGWFQCDEFLRIKGMEGGEKLPSFFAFGDCENTNLPTAGNQYFRANVKLGTNIVQAMAGTDTSKMQAIEKQFAMFIATTGPDTGVMYASDWFYTQYIFPWIKNSTMFFFSAKEALEIK